MTMRRRIAALERARGIGPQPARHPSLSDVTWQHVVARLPLCRMYPNNPEIWRRYGQS